MNLVSITIPTRVEEEVDLLWNLNHWNNPKYQPYETLPDQRLHLIVSLNGFKDVEYENRVTDYFASLDYLTKVFHLPVYFYAELTGLHDLYSRDHGNIEITKFGKVAGPNLQFFRTMNFVSQFGGVTFYMETDCYPIRKNWIGNIRNELSDMVNVWVLGSKYHGISRIESDAIDHLNGNALYHVGSKEFIDFLNNVWVKELVELIKTKKYAAYDILIVCLMKRLRQKNDFETLSFLKSRYLVAKFIRNYSGQFEYKKNTGIPLEYIKETYTSCYVVHGSYLREEIISESSIDYKVMLSNRVQKLKTLSGDCQEHIHTERICKLAI